LAERGVVGKRNIVGNVKPSFPLAEERVVDPTLGGDDRVSQIARLLPALHSCASLGIIFIYLSDFVLKQG
jgi:hypothetical protein